MERLSVPLYQFLPACLTTPFCLFWFALKPQNPKYSPWLWEKWVLDKPCVLPVVTRFAVRSYAKAAASSAPSLVSVLEIPGADHFDVVNAESAAWLGHVVPGLGKLLEAGEMADFWPPFKGDKQQPPPPPALKGTGNI